MRTQATRAMKLVKMSAVVRVMVVFACCLFLTQTSFAQNINTLGYATVDFDEENNIVYGYAFTEPGYSAGIYYNQTYVGATIFDANNNVVAAVPNHTAYTTRFIVLVARVSLRWPSSSLTSSGGVHTQLAQA